MKENDEKKKKEMACEIDVNECDGQGRGSMLEACFFSHFKTLEAQKLVVGKESAAMLNGICRVVDFAYERCQK